jgi:hypothetical protein
MDFSDPKVWKDSVGVLMNAPFNVVFLIAAAAGVTWWFISKLEKSRTDGLTGRMGVLEERLGLEEQRSQFAREREENVERKVPVSPYCLQSCV